MFFFSKPRKTSNLNLLERINRELGANFDLSKFSHYAIYNVYSGAVESYLLSEEEQDVRIEKINNQFHFKAWEPIHIEYSYKYLMSDIAQYAEDCGFEVMNNYTDSKKYFVVSVWKTTK